MVEWRVEQTIHKTLAGNDFPVRRIFCVGRNYVAHAREMGRDPNREPPFFFTKWAETLVNAGTDDGAEIVYPSCTDNYHHEIELVVAIGKETFRVDPRSAIASIWGYSVGLDMTRRDLQLEARESGRPWDTGKNVVQSSPVGRLVAVESSGILNTGAIEISVNGDVRQRADIGELIWGVDEIIAHLSQYYRLYPGDLIFTGTPAGVAAVVPGDVLSGRIDGLPSLLLTIGPRE